MLDAQTKRGVLEICILALRRGDSYGYELIRTLSACVTVSESTLYPILRRLENGGSMSVYRSEMNEFDLARCRMMSQLPSPGLDFKGDGIQHFPAEAVHLDPPLQTPLRSQIHGKVIDNHNHQKHILRKRTRMS